MAAKVKAKLAEAGHAERVSNSLRWPNNDTIDLQVAQAIKGQLAGRRDRPWTFNPLGSVGPHTVRKEQSRFRRVTQLRAADGPNPDQESNSVT